MRDHLQSTIPTARGSRSQAPAGRPRCAGCDRLVARTEQIYLGHGDYAHRACATYQRLVDRTTRRG
jgi:hypothetical protein